MFARAGVALCLVVVFRLAAADVIPVVEGELISGSSVVTGPGAATVTVVYEKTEFSLSVRMHLWSTQSTDGGFTWSTPQLVPMGVSEPIPSSFAFQESPALVLDGEGAFVLFQHFRIDQPSSIWRSTSADGISFPIPDRLDLGWPAVDDLAPGTGYPSVVNDGAASMAMLYQRFVADGADLPGLYLARSADRGATWSPIRIAVAGDAQLRQRASLAYAAADARYAVAYIASLSDSDNRVRVRITTDASDWSAAPILEVTGDNASPQLVRMADGAFVLFYERRLWAQSELFMRRSQDGLDWAGEVQLTESEDQFDRYPVAVLDPEPGFVDVYWTRDSSNGPETAIVHRRVATDSIFTSSFGD